MKIFFRGKGSISPYLPLKEYSMELQEHATLADFYNQLSFQLGDTFPSSIWNKEKKRFRDPVFIRSGKKILRDDSEILLDGDNLVICMFVSGG